MIHTDEFILDGKNFIYIDIKEFMSSDKMMHALEDLRQTIGKYLENSLYTITNIEHVMFDTKILEIAAKYMEYNKPYVKYGVMIGFDGITKILVNSILAKCKRNNIAFAFTKEQAIEFLLQQT